MYVDGAMPMLAFSKYQGLGNDFLLLDGREAAQADETLGLSPETVQRICDRRFGVGGDGVILALPPQQGGELRMRIFNADGSEAEMCGNGIRCLARFLADSDGDTPGRRWQVETLAGAIVPELLADGSVRVDMGEPFLQPADVPTTLQVGPAGLPQGELEAGGEPLPLRRWGWAIPISSSRWPPLNTLISSAWVRSWRWTRPSPPAPMSISWPCGRLTTW